MTYERVGDGLGRRIALEPGVMLRLVAAELRNDGKGVHGRLSILVNDVEMGYSSLNLDRDEDRNRLANSAFKEFARYLARNQNGADTHYTDADCRKDVRQFCSGLWQARIALDDIQAEWMAGTEAPVPTQFVLRPYVLHEGGTIVFAQPGNGKSYVVGLMSVSIDAADAIDEAHEIWSVPRQRRVLFINLERGRDSVRNRLGNINAALGLPRHRPLLTINARGKSLADVKDAARRAIEQHGAEMIVLDSISRAGLGDLNDNNPANKIVDMLNGLLPTWLAIAHAPRGSDEHLFGSIHFEAGADVVVRQLSAQEDGGPLGVSLEITKDNDVGKQGRRLLALDFAGELGLAGVRQPDEGEFPDLEGDGPRRVPATAGLSQAERLRRHMAMCGAQGDTVEHASVMTGIGRSHISQLVQGTDYFLVRRQGGKGQKVWALCAPGMERGPASDADDVPF